MNIIFLNSFYKEQEQGQVKQAQVIITEQADAWRVVWIEPDQDNRPQEDVWFEGTSLKELRDRFRDGIKVKLAVGYNPILDGVMHREESSSFISRKVQVLY
ncbi:MAG: aldolase, partial [Gorillibacterium sp.]|nr:aldolase [Gorillibacterium sp.]